MTALDRRPVRALLALVLLLAPGAHAQDPCAEAELAYRERRYEDAERLWRECAREPRVLDSPEALSAALYDLGNAAYRRDEPLRALARYTAASRLTPRDADVRANLELARAEAELPPSDRGDLTSTLGRLFGALTVPEAERLLLVMLLVWAGTLAGEALRGRAWRLPVGIATGVTLLTAISLFVAHSREGSERVMVIARDALALRSEPRTDATALLRLGPGEEVVPSDALPGWIQVEAAGVRGWIPVGEVEASDPPAPGE